jgi:hypothetical protein
MMLASRRTESRSPILLGEVSFQPHSFADDAGRLFYWNGNLHRAIALRQTPLFTRLFSDGIIESLAERGLLVETEATDLSVEGFGMVVSHRTLPFISYPNEWCPAMLKNAAVTIIDLTLELAERGLTLKDAHPWNVLFDSHKPVYVDLTSIVPIGDEGYWPAYDEFCRFCYYPLILMSHGQERIARALLPEYEGIRRKDLLTVMRGSAPSWFVLSKVISRGARLIQSALRKEPSAGKRVIEFLTQVKVDLEALQPPYESLLKNEPVPSLESSLEWTPEQRAVREILTELRPSSVLDLSRGVVWSSTLPAVLGYNVVSVDSDPARVTSIYETARSMDLPILPLVIDFIKPTPSVGYSNHYSIAATERLKSDLVVALGLANVVARENHFSFDLIAEGLFAFSKRWLVVEPVTRDGNRESYQLGEFIESLSKRFVSVKVMPFGEGREVLLCEK